jgi:hypothetical protein
LLLSPAGYASLGNQIGEAALKRPPRRPFTNGCQYLIKLCSIMKSTDNLGYLVKLL